MAGRAQTTMTVPKKRMKIVKARMGSMVLMGVVYRVRGSVWECIPESLVAILRAFRRDRHFDNVLNNEGADATLHVVVVDGDGGVPVLIGLGDGDLLHAIPECSDQRGVARGEAAGGLPVTLAVGDLHPPGGEEGHHAVVPLGDGGHEGEDDARTVGAGGAHAYIVAHEGECV